ncbi:MAG: cytochrome c3 family protein [Phycisphaerae bacterium]|nr:cytochrome c3 family protein [Phycisphaerae bacterium]MCZ2399720.1 cytochrome c3 family protein [Phycisphaerae bacterium]
MVSTLNTIPTPRSPAAVRHALLLLSATLLLSGVIWQAEPPREAPAAPPTAVADTAAIERRAGGIVGSKHDFTQGGAAVRDLCLPCHTPHITASEAPLLTQRASGRMRPRGYGAMGIELDAASLLCLSCHDGVIATDVFTGPHAMSWAERSGGGAAPGASRLTSHPVGIEYPSGAPRYASATTVNAAGLKLPNGRIQCTTCHDPHNTHNHAGMLTISNARSRLCLTCHRL